MTGSEPIGLDGLGLTDEVRERLELYSTLLLEANAQTNLTGAKTREEVAAHIVDSLALVAFVAGPLVDIGSGGGFPAIPLVIATGMEATVIESVAKKARFLESVVAALRLPVRVRAQRAEDAARDPALREKFASATARAVGSAPSVLELTLPFLALGGVAVLQRGRLTDAERTATQDAALVLGGALRDEIRPERPEDERRVLLVVKERPTGPRFPRRAGVPARRPLCYSAGEPGDG